MHTGLLAVNLAVPIAIGAGVLALAAFLYGIFRKFTRVSWLSWQTLLVFAATLLLGFFPVPSGAWDGFAVAAALLAGTSAVVLILGGTVRHAMLARVRPAPLFFRFLSRLLGGLTALLNLVVFLVVLAAPVLAALPLFGAQPAPLDVLYQNSVWTEFLGPHALDLLLSAVCLVMMRAGYRIGLARSVWTVFTIALGVGALVLSGFMAVNVPFLADFAQSIAGGLPATLGAGAGVLGTVIVAAICFAVMLIVIILVTLLINLLVKKLKGNFVLGVIDGVLMAVVFTALFFVIGCGVDLGVHYLAENASSFPEGAAEMIGSVAGNLEALFTSSPLSGMLYDYNPVLLLLA